jgi:hypothetical protein
LNAENHILKRNTPLVYQLLIFFGVPVEGLHVSDSSTDVCPLASSTWRRLIVAIKINSLFPLDAGPVTQ